MTCNPDRKPSLLHVQHVNRLMLCCTSKVSSWQNEARHMQNFDILGAMHDRWRGEAGCARL